MTKTIRNIFIGIAGCLAVLVLCNAAQQNRAEQSFRPLEIGTVSNDHKEIVTGLCTFGDCKVETLQFVHTSTQNETEENTTVKQVMKSDDNASIPAGDTPSVRHTVPEMADTASSAAELEETTEHEPETEAPPEEEPATEDEDVVAVYSSSYFRRMGVIRWGGWRWTWYSERVLPGTGLHIPGRHADGNGYIRDGDGYICCASDVLGYGAIVETPFGGYGKIYDCGCDADVIDVYVNW